MAPALALALAAGAALAGCGDDDDGPNDSTEVAAYCAARGTLPDIDGFRAPYGDDGVEVQAMRIVAADASALAAVEADVPGAEVAVHVSEGDFAANGTMRLRGFSTRNANQRSYRIKLRDGATWRGREVIHLNKHPWDLTRVRQKLSFDLIRQVPHMVSLDTRFIRLAINDMDHGLYTSVENPDEHFLVAHGLPPGNVYLPEYFDFAPIPEDAWQDPDKLEAIIEPKTDPDLAKLRRMIDAVNDPSRSIDDVVQAYFQRDNYLAWLALNVVMGNWDMGATNYLIYSPSGCEGYYFLPWDYDGAWDYYGQPGVPPEQRFRWRAGLTVYWGSALHARFLREPANVAAVEATMQALWGGAVTDAEAAARLDRYRAVVSEAVGMAPDVWYLPTAAPANEPEAYAAWQSEYERLRGVATSLREEYGRVRERPAPVWLNAVDEGAEIYLEWGESYDFQGDALSYDFELAHTSSFAPEEMVIVMPGLMVPEGDVVGSVRIARPPPGEYYWRVVVRDGKDPAGSWQIPFVGSETLTVAAMAATTVTASN